MSKRTLGLALVGLGLACTHAALAQPAASGSKVGTVRGSSSGGASNGSVVTVNSRGGSGSRQIATIAGERRSVSKPAQRVAARTPQRTGTRLGPRIDREPPIVRVRRAASDRQGGLLPEVPMLDQSRAGPFTLAMADTSSISLVQLDVPRLLAPEYADDASGNLAALVSFAPEPEPISEELLVAQRLAQMEAQRLAETALHAGAGPPGGRLTANAAAAAEVPSILSTAVPSTPPRVADATSGSGGGLVPAAASGPTAPTGPVSVPTPIIAGGTLGSAPRPVR